ncbi:hypothetical protein D3C87_1825180 [compost metagenome]
MLQPLQLDRTSLFKQIRRLEPLLLLCKSKDNKLEKSVCVEPVSCRVQRILV